MRNVKWYIIAIVVVLLLCILIFGGQCGRIYKTYEFSQDRDQVVKIEFIYIEKYSRQI